MSAGAEATAPAVSVVVPVLDAAATIDRALAGLRAQRLDRPHETIFVDCGSDDGTLERVAAEPGITVLTCPVRNPGAARNLGARHARASVLAFTDADCVPDPSWLEAGLAALAHADLVQGRVIPAAPGGRYDRTVSVGAEGGLYETANLFVSAEAFRAAGGFRSVPGIRLRPGHHFGEDTDFAWRARRTGARTAFAPAALVRHAVFPRSPGGYLTERLRARHFPGLVREVPELREAFLTCRWFLSPSSLCLDLAAAGWLTAARSGRRRYGWVGSIPYAALALRRGGNPAVELAADLTTAAALLTGSLRSRCPVG